MAKLIEDLITQLSNVPDLTHVWAILFFLGFGLGGGGLALYMFQTNPNQVNHGLHLCLLGFAVIGICVLVIIPNSWEVKDLRDEIKSEHIDIVKEMTCEEMRIEITDTIERKNDPRLKPYDYQRANLEWEKEYRDSKCNEVVIIE